MRQFGRHDLIQLSSGDGQRTEKPFLPDLNVRVKKIVDEFGVDNRLLSLTIRILFLTFNGQLKKLL